jgi:mRNA-degrading endonuclease toxin of MazEF toxin-antitoxin module
MKKDFDKWSKRKQEIDSSSVPPLFNEGEVWHCHMGINVGFETDGKENSFLRPVFILKKFNQHTFWAVPLTHTGKSSIYYHQLRDSSLGYLNLSQLRLMDTRRLLRRKVRMISDEVLEMTSSPHSATLRTGFPFTA